MRIFVLKILKILSKQLKNFWTLSIVLKFYRSASLKRLRINELDLHYTGALTVGLRSRDTRKRASHSL